MARRRPAPLPRRSRPQPRPLREFTYRFPIAASPSGGYVDLTAPEGETITATVPAHIPAIGSNTVALVRFTGRRAVVDGWAA
ncbi:hypothetical protein [Glycomyces buryatensis]|uniref:Uncharacterized protein n=1 Tax=Glycomyces buryatensis TaxID=2570927 RepID=A0A4S8QEH0_9ACTN|nr:hypothetical protein [Glycomyces buryatensis]THV39609.1 hypothetical protein FAB82_17210 [Glycomyces buryatensis]